MSKKTINLSDDGSHSASKRAPVNKYPADGDPYIVGIGASAGGLLAFEQLFRALPVDAGIAYVVVQHLSAPHKSILPEILQRYTKLKVAQVAEDVEVLPDHVYVIPPGNELSIERGRLVLHKSETQKRHPLVIDHFFISLAKDQGVHAIGVVLSGTGNDGSVGLSAIKDAGGLTLAQAPDSAEYADMPLNAIATQDVDFVLPPEKMGELILKHIRHQKLNGYRSAEPEIDLRSGGLQKLYFMLRSKTGHDFSLYKQNTLLRRINRRMKILRLHTVDDYIRWMEQDPEEIKALFDDMLINVTRFFRDPEAFDALTQKVIRPLIEIKTNQQQPLRVWVPACSSGEEAYSIGIQIHEQMEALGSEIEVQIFATDLDAASVEIARKGIYPPSAMENVSDERLKRYFQKEDDGYQIKKKIRDLMIFSTQNLISDPVFSKTDLISCRNLLIYLEHELQNLLFNQFHYSLNPDGFLFLGNSESVSGNSELFLVVDRKNKIYQRKETAARYRFKLKSLPFFERTLPPEMTPAENDYKKGNLREWVEKTLLELHTPACAVIDSKHNILYIHGRTGRYLEPVPGEINTDIIRMAREGLKTSLATALYTSAVNRETVVRQNVRVKTNGDYQTIHLTVRPMEGPGGYGDLTLVVFEPAIDVPALPLESGDLDALQYRSDKAVDLVVFQLQKELKEKDEYLHTVIDDLENTNHDLKSSNEELQSINEEMQSTNEEMETSKEELQSINEELTTINNELQTKNDELSGVNNDIYNLLAGIEIGIIFLDLDLRIRRFTPSVNRIYNLFPADIGRPISHFISSLGYSNLLTDVKQVLRTLIPKAIEVQSNDGTWFLINIRPYRTTENVIDGVVITFVDISEQKQGDVLRRLGTILRDSNDAIILQDLSGNIQAWNRGAEKIYGWGEQEALRMNTLDMIAPDRRAEFTALAKRLSEGEVIAPFETQRMTRDGRVVDIWITMTVTVDDDDRPVGIATTETDITARHQKSQANFFDNRALKALKAWYQALPVLSARTFENLSAAAGQAVIRAGYHDAWIGKLSQQDDGVSPLVWHGQQDGRPQPRLVEELEPIQRAMTEERPVVIRNYGRDGAQAERVDATPADKKGSFIAVPIFEDSRPAGVLVVYADEPEAFTVSEVEALAEIANDFNADQNS